MNKGKGKDVTGTAGGAAETANLSALRRSPTPIDGGAPSCSSPSSSSKSNGQHANPLPHPSLEPTMQEQHNTSSGSRVSNLFRDSTGTPSSTTSPMASSQTSTVAPTAISSATSSPDPTPSLILPLLACQLCLNSLHDPTTLHCGHTICAAHVRSPLSQGRSHQHGLPVNPRLPVLPACPLSACTRSTSTSRAAFQRPNIPSTSRVAYLPPPPTPTFGPAPPSPVTHIPDPKIDVTLNKIMNLVAQAQNWIQDEDSIAANANNFVSGPAGVSGDDDTDESDYEPSNFILIDDRTGTDQPPPHTRGTNITPHAHGRPRASSDSSGRPRKRRRHHVTSPSNVARQTRAAPVNSPLNAMDRFEKELLSELTCEICFTLMYQPVTTPCQHSFCSKCLHRSLDHRQVCPLCRQDLPEFTYFQDHPCNHTLLSIILQAFPSIYTARGEAMEAEERDARLDTPIFVCQLSFPGIPTWLHFFEPRYRLMLRRCLESPTPRFGMIMPPRAAPTSGPPEGEYGTMLEIRGVQMLPDGRSMVETWGTFRFRILERSSLDGYAVARIERVDDFEEEIDDFLLAQETSATPTPPQPPPSPSPIISVPLTSSGGSSTQQNSDASEPSAASSSSAPPPTSPSNQQASSSSSNTPLPVPGFRTPSNAELMSICHNFLHQLRSGTAPWVVQRLNDTYGPMPTDPSLFSFWICLVLPIDEHEKAKLLPIRSPRLRLRLVVHWIEQLNNNWWVLGFSGLAIRFGVGFWTARASLVLTMFALGIALSSWCGRVADIWNSLLMVLFLLPLVLGL